MGAVDLLGVEPEVPAVRILQGQLVVLAVVPAHQHPEAGGRAELPRGGGPGFLLFALALLF